MTDICYFSYLGEQPIGLQGFEYVAKLDLSGRPRFKLVINDSFDNDFSDELVGPAGMTNDSGTQTRRQGRTS